MKLLTQARDLKRRKARERSACFVAEGLRSVEALLASPMEAVGVLCTAEFARSPRGMNLLLAARDQAVTVQEITEGELESAASTESPQGVLAVARIPTTTLEPPPGPSGRYLLLDALQDPGNVGTIIRTAAALGVTQTIALPGTVDLWNAKVVRSTMGALFVHPVVADSWEAVVAFLELHAIACWAADTGGTVLSVVDDAFRQSLPARLALVVSNEGAGLTDHIRPRVSHHVAIGMRPEVESLNVAVAAGILLHALRPV